MIIRRARHFTVKMGGVGEYEMYRFGADVEMSHEDLGIATSEVVKMTTVELAALRERITEAVLAELDEQLIGELQETAELTENKKSFILKAINHASAMPVAKPKATPRKVVRHA